MSEVINVDFETKKVKKVEIKVINADGKPVTISTSDVQDEYRDKIICIAETLAKICANTTLESTPTKDEEKDENNLEVP